MTLKLITEPAAEPLALADAKLRLRVDSDITDDDDLITSLIVSARQQCEHLLGRSLINQTWERVLDYFPACEIELGVPPVQSITSVIYIDGSGSQQTLSSAAYRLDADNDPGWLLPSYGYVWPVTYATSNAVRVRFLTGYGAASSDVPATIIDWIGLRVGTLYKFREEIMAGAKPEALPGGWTDRLLDRYRLHV